MSVRLIESLATTEALAEVFSDESTLRAMLDFEIALARVEARLGLIPPSAADAIRQAAHAGGWDPVALARDALRAGTPAIPLVKALTGRVRAIDPAAAG
ncbi:MAG: 3-carboxy-cis,cis-muconate cycloisomerase, partial [Acidobacteria bacterium]|nr:3-carboxy-cis,cis-muconate cycloisomerase [Acidobacteriota bacterium]